MDKFIIHYCDSTKEVNILIDGVLPTTAFTIGASGGVIEVPYSGCVSSVTIDSSVTYTIDSVNKNIIFTIPNSTSSTERIFNFTVTWCNGNGTDAVITQAAYNYLPYGTAYTIRWEGGTIEIPYYGCVSSVSGDFDAYTIGSSAFTVTIGENRVEDIITHNLTVHWCSGEYTDIIVKQSAYIKGYLAFNAIDDITIKFIVSNSSTKSWLECSTNGTSWGHMPPTGISISSGSTVFFRGKDLICDSVNGIGIFKTTGRFTLKGNIMSLVDRYNFEEKTDIDNSYQFKYLFLNCSGLTSAEYLSLPATGLMSWCYFEMFSGCTSLTTAPELPATNLKESCYQEMFGGCTSLTTAPTICATTMAESACTSMFSGCTALTTAPILSATTLADSCCKNMFSRCRSLTTSPSILPATTLAAWCYAGMFYGCHSLTTAPELPATTLAACCYSSMFGDCMSLTTAPELPATTLAVKCYDRMFYGCTSLTTAPTLSADTLVTRCYESMFQYCRALNSVTCLATDISASYCTSQWLFDVSSSGTFTKKSTMSRWSMGADGIPKYWTVNDA